MNAIKIATISPSKAKGQVAEIRREALPIANMLGTVASNPGRAPAPTRRCTAPSARPAGTYTLRLRSRKASVRLHESSAASAL